MMLTIASEVAEAFPDLKVLARKIYGVTVERQNAELERFKAEVVSWVKKRFKLETLKDEPIFRAYREFFWRIGVDPTKHRPASEALIRRILSGKTIPTINTVVDAYNLASIQTGVALAVFDLDKLKGSLQMRFAKPGEAFLGIGMEKPLRLEGGEIVVSDEEKLVAVYPYRDADSSKVTLQTENLLILVCGVPGIPQGKLLEAAEVCVKNITKFCGGKNGNKTF